jgi:cysteine desulfurase
VYEPAQQLKQFGKTVHVVSANRNGFVDPQKIADRIDPQTTLVSVMLVNNETGAIQPLEQICSCIREKQREMGTSIHIHSDMVQALGKIPLALNTLDIDSATFSGHKLCAPRGVGLLYLRKPVPVLHRGGEQEFRLRPGTENLPGIWAFSQAAKKYLPSVAEHNKEAWRLKNLLRTELSETGFCEFIEEEGSPHYSPFITSILIPPAPGEVIVRVMSDKGYALSTGAACSTSQKKRTRTLENMGIERAKAFSAIRISIGYTTSKEDIRSFVHTLKQEIPPLLKIAT